MNTKEFVGEMVEDESGIYWSTWPVETNKNEILITITIFECSQYLIMFVMKRIIARMKTLLVGTFYPAYFAQLYLIAYTE